MKSERALIFGVTVLTFLHQIIGWRPYYIKKLNVTAFSLSDIVAHNASITKDNGVSSYFNVKETIQQPFARVEFYVDAGDGLYDLQYINETIDVCRFFRDKTYLPLMQIIYRLILENGNYPTSCPIKKKLYVAENIKENVELLPSVLPEKQFYLGYIFYSMEDSVLKPIAVFKLYFKIVRK